MINLTVIQWRSPLPIYMLHILGRITSYRRLCNTTNFILNKTSYISVVIVLCLQVTSTKGNIVANNPSVSTIIPVYNREDLVASSIDSILNQTYKCHEIIVVDDGSTDNTLESLKQYQDKIKIIQKDNGGSASARNIGLKHASGDYIAYLDSDDTWHPDKLSIFVNSLSLCKESKNLFMFSDFRRFDVFKNEYLALSQTENYPIIFDYFKKVGDSLYVCEGVELLKCLLEPYPLYPSTFLLSRDLHDKHLWLDDFNACEDFEIVLRIYKQTKFYYIDKILSTMGMHDTNITWEIDSKRQGDIDAINNFYQSNVPDKNERALCNAEIGKRYWAFAHYHRSKNKYLYALCCYIKGLKYIENVKRLFKSFFKTSLLSK
jgi:glycosyltransferase involved in cell wall biosynthesis